MLCSQRQGGCRQAVAGGMAHDHHTGRLPMTTTHPWRTDQQLRLPAAWTHRRETSDAPPPPPPTTTRAVCPAASVNGVGARPALMSTMWQPSFWREGCMSLSLMAPTPLAQSTYLQAGAGAAARGKPCVSPAAGRARCCAQLLTQPRPREQATSTGGASPKSGCCRAPFAARSRAQ